MAEEYAALRSNVSMLGRILGQEITRSEGQDFFDTIERIRQLSKSSRAGDRQDRKTLLDLLTGLKTEQLTPVARAFSHFLNLANIADQHHAISREVDAKSSATLTLERVLAKLRKEVPGDNKQAIVDAVLALKIELVLTAHPTEITRRSLINKYLEIDRCLSEYELDGHTQREQDVLQWRLEELIGQVWHTNEFRQKRPTPVDEAKWGFAVVENSLWDAVPAFMRRLHNSLEQATGVGLPLDYSPVSFCSWMGGDRDGNPFVTAAVTREVLLISRWKAIDLYLTDLNTLINELSMHACDETVRQLAGDSHEPYRVILRDLRRLLRNTWSVIEHQLENKEPPAIDTLTRFDQLWDPLYACYQSMHNSGLGMIADSKLLDLLRRVQCFGLHLVRLDVRQESSHHSQVFSELTQYLDLGDYAEWDEAKRQAFLIEELQNKRPLFPLDWQPSEGVQEVLDTCREVARHPREALGCYVISMAKQPSDVLAVTLLLQEAGCAFNLPVAPLFETLDDLNRAPSVMQQLYEHDYYRELIQQQQVVMIGYSDSAKDAGMLAAGWAQYQAQEAVLEVSEQAGVALTLFHGRGGTIGRGGAPAHAALLSQPPGTLKHGLRVTEQGEMIRAKLGLSRIAIKNLALYASAVLEANLLEPPAPKAEWRSLMDDLSESSCNSYRAVVREEPRFVEYFRAATPEQELGKLPLGSRPARRKQGGGIETLRAIPWIFAWSQNRLMLPAWLGAGQAIQKAVDAGQADLLEAMCQEWPFFSTRLSMLEMVFAKADVGMSAYYDYRLVPEELLSLGKQLREQMRQDIKTVLAVANESSLMEGLPWLKESVQLRNIYIDPLNVLQAELLFRHRQEEEPDPDVELAVMVTIAGIAAGLRNTG